MSFWLVWITPTALSEREGSFICSDSCTSCALER